MIRLLHTSDWHLGATLEGISRERDHTFFLDWLADALEKHEVDVLLVCGDVFDQAQPSAEAQRLYYRFLHRIAGGRVRKVVVVGGNHDSAARLDAPRELLDQLSVHVVGGLQSDPASWDRCLCPVGDRAAPDAVVLAVPFVHEFRLGVRTTVGETAEIARAIRDRFGDLYRTLADKAEVLAGGAPLVATGHLACAGAKKDYAPLDIHLIGTLGGLPSDIFDPRLQYVALGHIHRSYRIGQTAAWYSGSPVSLGIKEADTPRKVLLVDVEAGSPASVTPLEVPALRRIEVLHGDVDAVARRLRELTWQSELPPLVYAMLEVDHLPAGVQNDLRNAAAANPRGALQVVDFRVALQRAAGAVGETKAPPRLRDLSPEDVFLRLCADRGEEADDALITAFRSLLSVDDEGAENQEGGAR